MLFNTSLKRILWAVAVMVGSAAVMIAIYAATSHDSERATTDAAVLKKTLDNFIAPLSLTPFNSSTEPTEVRVKNAAPYYVSTGLLKMSEDDARTAIAAQASHQSWTIVSRKTVDVFLGWELLATKDHMTLHVNVGKEAVGVTNSPYTARDGYVYVQSTVASAQSGSYRTKRGGFRNLLRGGF